MTDNNNGLEPSLRQMFVCKHECNKEVFHSVWGFGNMCSKCKKVLWYKEHKQNLGEHTDCVECHYWRKDLA